MEVQWTQGRRSVWRQGWYSVLLRTLSILKVLGRGRDTGDRLISQEEDVTINL